MEETISQRLEKLERETRDNQEPAPRKFKLPLMSKIQRGKVLKREFVHVWMIKQNKSVQIKTLPVEDGTVKFGDYFYDARAANILRWKNMPVLILKEWSTEPETPQKPAEFDPVNDYKLAAKSGKLTMPQKLILTKMKMEAIKPKMNMNMGTIVVILAVLGIGYYFLSSSGMI